MKPMLTLGEWMRADRSRGSGVSGDGHQQQLCATESQGEALDRADVDMKIIP